MKVGDSGGMASLRVEEVNVREVRVAVLRSVRRVRQLRQTELVRGSMTVISHAALCLASSGRLGIDVRAFQSTEES